MTKLIWTVYYVVLLTIFCVGIFTAIHYLISRETTDDESDINWICPYISRHLLSLNPLLACCR
ncbi:hypothetical protein G9Q31_023995, partial [Escherichia coli]|nr:hypothetical protein [Escherichia coli]